MTEFGKLPTDYSAFIHTSRYARWNEDEQRRETWEETVTRYVDNVIAPVLDDSVGFEWEIYDAITTLDVMPSMRSLMTAGPALERDNTAGYNCSYLPVDSLRSFDEAMFILLCGTGVGFSVESQFVRKLPPVPDYFVKGSKVITVEDSKEGWARAFRELLECLFLGTLPDWDTGEVRPAGTKLKTFGGRASGPEPLEDLFRFTVALVTAAEGRQLRPIECHDLMCKIGEIVVVGGVRRSAMISLSDLNDAQMAMAKSGEWWVDHPYRALANNSAVYEGKPDREVFDEEWQALIASQSGERGIFNREALQTNAMKYGRRDHTWQFGTNPCSEISLRPYQFCVAPSTPLITKTGLHKISEVENEKVEIWNGEQWSEVTIRKTGTNQKLVRVHLSDGSYLDCTPKHRFSAKTRFQKEFQEVYAKDLMDTPYPVQLEPYQINHENGVEYTDAYTMGFALGDGHLAQGKVAIALYGEKTALPVKARRGPVYRPRGYNVDKVDAVTDLDAKLFSDLRTNPDALSILYTWDKNSILRFFAGWIDADGSETGTGGVRLYIGNEEMARQAQLLLTFVGVRSSANLMQKAGKITNFGPRNKPIWYLQITECQGIPCHRVDTSKGHAPRFKGKYVTVRAVEGLEGLHDTFCFNEPLRHKGVFGNVLTHQCNLSEVVVRPWDDLKTIAWKIRIATIIGTVQSTLTDFPYLRPIWKENTEEERLLGVSLTGIMDNPITYAGPDLDMRLEYWRKVAQETNAVIADHLGIPRSTAITCVKPSGTVSQLVDSASGIHSRHSPFYIRTVRGDNKDPLTQFMASQGIPNEPCVMKPETTTVFSFPQKAPENAVTRDDRTAIEELTLWLQYQRYYCEHKPSVTITVRDHEWKEVGDFVYENFDEMSGVSFLPHSDHTYQQAPYQEVTESVYNFFKEKMPAQIDWSKLSEFEKEDTTKSAQTYACQAGICEIVDIS